MNLDTLKTAEEIHRQDWATSAAYRRAYRRQWLPARASLLWLRLKTWWGD